MAINKQTIISVYDEKLTLLQWLKTVNQALDAGTLTGIEVRQKGNATFTFVITFEDGTFIESNEFILNKGDSVSRAYIEDGHLYIELTNEEVVDAGNIKPVSSFAFNASRHLIVYYGDGTNQDLGLIKGVDHFALDDNKHLIAYYDNGTSEDLGAIIQGEVDFSNIDLVAKTLSQTNANWVQTLSTFVISQPSIVVSGYQKAIVVNGILHVVCALRLTNPTANDISGRIQVNTFTIPEQYADKIYGVDGTKLSEMTSQTIIRYFKGILSNYDLFNIVLTGGANRQVYFYAPTILTIPANSYLDLSFELNLVLF